MKKSFVAFLFGCLTVGAALTSFAATEDDSYPKSAADRRAEEGGSILELFGKKKGEPLIKRSAPGQQASKPSQAQPTQSQSQAQQPVVAASSDKSGVNYRECLWRVVKEEFKAHPIQVSDFQGGVLATDWFDVPGKSDERQKLTALILPGSSKQKHSYELSVTVKRETFKDGRWQGHHSADEYEVAGLKELKEQVKRECK